MLKKKRPDVEIVGDHFSPLAQVRDFSAYVAKIKQSGADTVITGNWGSDLALLIKAANDAGPEQCQVLHLLRHCHRCALLPWRSRGSGQGLYGGLWPPEHAREPWRKSSRASKAKVDDDMYTGTVYTGLNMLDQASAEARLRTRSGCGDHGRHGIPELRPVRSDMRRAITSCSRACTSRKLGKGWWQEPH